MPGPVIARLAFLILLGALSAAAATTPQGPASRPVRVLLATMTAEAPIIASGSWQLVDAMRRAVATGTATERWSVQREGLRLRAIRSDAPASGWVSSPLSLETTDDAGHVGWDRKSYRGGLVFVATDSSLLVVNRLDVEDYLRGVLPLEIGARQTDDHAAVEAQAVAARSFTYTKMLAAGTREFDVRATDSDQVYGGVAVETFWGDLAVAATAGWILSDRGQIVSAPYHSACGGVTAAPSEVWRAGQDGFLRSVSDLNPRTGQPWCAIAPRATWERRLTRAEIAGAMSLYVDVAAVPRGAMRVVRDVRVDGETPSGRVRAIVVTTGDGEVTIRGNDVRQVLRAPGMEILPSTWFSMSAERGSDGELHALLLRGRGNGHGVGLCQWGAIARARAGADFRAILKAYYPGADLVRAP